jgi:hypothetical protein
MPIILQATSLDASKLGGRHSQLLPSSRMHPANTAWLLLFCSPSKQRCPGAHAPPPQIVLPASANATPAASADKARVRDTQERSSHAPAPAMRARLPASQRVLSHSCMASADPPPQQRQLLFVAPAGAWPPAAGAGDGVATGGGTGTGVAPPLLLPVSAKSVVLLPQFINVIGTAATTFCAAALPLAACVRPSTEGVTEAELSACRQEQQQHACQHTGCRSMHVDI